MKKTGKILTAAAVTLALTAAGGAGIYYGISWNQAVTVDGIRYPESRKPLDLRNEQITLEHYLNLREAFPEREILWNVPFQQRSYPSNTEKITITSLKKEDVKMLRYLPRLTEIDASNCFDYEALDILRKELPDCRIESFVAVDGQILPRGTEELSFQEGSGNFDELLEKLAYLPELKKVSFEEPNMTAEELSLLQKTYPQVEFSWTKYLFGKNLSSDLEELDISGKKFASIEEVESQTAFLPGLKKLTMCHTDLPYEDIAEFRERNRDRFKVIFNVIIKNLDVRTDILRFVPGELGAIVSECDTRHLVYCEDLVYVNMHGSFVRNIDWVRGTPHLQCLVIEDSPFRDLQPLRYARELKLLVLKKLDLRDMQPLLDCTALEDLIITDVYPDISVLGKMTWLKNLWTSGGKDELQSMLPHTKVYAASKGGWVNLPNYKKMRALEDPHPPKILKNPPKRDITPGFYIPKM